MKIDLTKESIHKGKLKELAEYVKIGENIAGVSGYRSLKEQQQIYQNSLAENGEEFTRKYAADFGFIERYPKDKEKITGIGAEPWHFRYVGTPHAKLMYERNMVLEEYIQWIKQYDMVRNPLVLIDRLYSNM